MADGKHKRMSGAKASKTQKELKSAIANELRVNKSHPLNNYFK